MRLAPVPLGNADPEWQPNRNETEAEAYNGGSRLGWNYWFALICDICERCLKLANVQSSSCASCVLRTVSEDMCREYVYYIILWYIHLSRLYNLVLIFPPIFFLVGIIYAKLQKRSCPWASGKVYFNLQEHSNISHLVRNPGAWAGNVFGRWCWSRSCWFFMCSGIDT